MLKNLKRLRKETGVSQQELADAVGVSQQSVNKYENHSIEPDIETIIRIADYLHVSVDELIGHTRERGEALCADELRLIADYRNLSARQRRALRELLESITESR